MLVLKNCLSVYRSNLCFVQDELAKMVGTSRITISNIENNHFVPSVKLALLLAFALDCKVEDIFYFDKEN